MVSIVIFLQALKMLSEVDGVFLKFQIIVFITALLINALTTILFRVYSMMNYMNEHFYS